MRNVCVDMQGNHPLLMPFPDIQSVSDYGNGSLGNITPTAQPSQESTWCSLVTQGSESYHHYKFSI